MIKIVMAASAACLSVVLVSAVSFGAAPDAARVLASARAAYGPLDHPGVLIEQGTEHASGLDGAGGSRRTSRPDV